jgi:tRNA-2-methylthio-N6-dimethylallyladenosine synthase
MPRFFVRTFGCQMNEHDSERIARLLRGRGMEPADSEADADVVIFNTCTIRANADERFLAHVNRLKARKRADPSLRIVVAGCLAQAEKEHLFELVPHVDVVVGTQALGRLVELVEETGSGGRAIEVGAAPSEPFELAPEEPVAHKAFVTIQTGCDNHCAFCIVPSVRGREASRPIEEILVEVEALARRGVTEVTLLGQNVNSYGRDLVLRARRAELARQGDLSRLPRVRPLFAELLARVGAVEGIRRVFFTSPHPKDMREETFWAMAETEAVCESLHFPLQSGSDRVLAAMHRGYTAERFLARLARAREVVPDLAVTTDIIVGFPGETDEDFEATLEVVAAAQFDSAFTFLYSPRPGTEAAAWVERYIPDEVAHRRFDRLIQVVERSARARHEARIGRVEEVLIDGPSKRDPSVASGRTRQHKLVHLGGVDPVALAGAYVSAEITGASAHYLRGRLVEVLSVPTRAQAVPAGR